MFKQLPGIGIQFKAYQNESILGRENVTCLAEVVNRSLKADCTDFTCGSSLSLYTLECDQELCFNRLQSTCGSPLNLCALNCLPL